MTEERFDEWLETQPIEDKLVYLKYKYSHEEEWTFSNEILEVDMSVDGYYVWSNDWDEGQQDVEILGCIAISDIDVPVFTQADTPQTEQPTALSNALKEFEKDAELVETDKRSHTNATEHFNRDKGR